MAETILADSMLADKAATGFARLHALGLITLAQQDAALANPLYVLIKRDTTPANHLVWMVEKRLLSHQSLDQMAYPPSGALEQGWADEGTAIRHAALEELQRRAAAINGRLLDELLASGLITHADRHALPALGAPYALASPAEALALLVENKVVSAERFTQLREHVRFERHVRQAEGRAQIIEQTAAVLALRAQQRSLTEPAARSTVGAWWKRSLALGLVLIVTYQLAPTVFGMILDPITTR